jgi:hypothetical protein
MPKIRTSRRVTGLKDSDYDHEISLVDHDTAASPRPLSTETTDIVRTSTGSALLTIHDSDVENDGTSSGHVPVEARSEISPEEGTNQSLSPAAETRPRGPSIEIQGKF